MVAPIYSLSSSSFPTLRPAVILPVLFIVSSQDADLVIFVLIEVESIPLSIPKINVKESLSLLQLQKVII